MSYFINRSSAIVLICLLLCSTSGAVQEDVEVDFDPFGSGQSDADAQGLAQNITDSGPIIPQVTFNNNDISMALQIISDATGWSIFPTTEVSRAKVSLWAKNVTARELLDTIVTLTGFIYHQDNNVITVMTYNEYIRYYGLSKKVVFFKYADASSIAGVIKPFLTKLGKSVVHKETNTLVLYDSDANLEIIMGVIEKLDTPAENIVAEVIELKYADCESLAKILQNVFVSQNKIGKNKSPGPTTSNGRDGTEIRNTENILISYNRLEIYAISRTNQLVAVGTMENVRKIKEMVALVDICGDNMALEVVDLEYADAETMADILRQIFAAEDTKNNAKAIQKENTEQKITESAAATESLVVTAQAYMEIYPVGRTNQLIIKAFRSNIKKLKKLIEKLDTYVEPTTKNYHFTYVDASEIYSGLGHILDVSGRNSASRRKGKENDSFRPRRGTTLVEKTNSILLTGPPSIHRIMTSIVENIDVPGTYETGMIKIYKLENADVDEVAGTVRELIQSESDEKNTAAGVKYNKESAADKSTTGTSFCIAFPQPYF